jgi:hypothetical protein
VPPDSAGAPSPGPWPGEAALLARLRAILSVVLLLGLLGTGLELLLLEHFEGFWQPVPLALIGLGTLALGWHARRPSRESVRLLQGAMALCVAGGLLGLGLHYRGNMEFELELHAEQAGLALFRAVMMGATPVLAPGALIQLGLVGLAVVYRHPAAAASPADGPPNEQGGTR